ncbi:hypothetical protein ACM66B_004617 [Microbotryomycetes sp. NB124-2]
MACQVSEQVIVSYRRADTVLVPTFSSSSDSGDDGQARPTDGADPVKDEPASAPAPHSPLSSFDGLFEGLPPAAPSSYTTARTASANRNKYSTPPPPPPLEHSFSTPVQSRGMQRQRQNLSQSEKNTFTDLLESILQSSQRSGTGTAASTGADSTLVDVLDSLSVPHRQSSTSPHHHHSTLPGGAAGSPHDKAQQDMLNRMKRHFGRSRVELGQRELEQLDRMREDMMSFDSDLELLRWSMYNVFGFQLDQDLASVFPDMSIVAHPPPPLESPTSFESTSSTAVVKGPASPIYADLLLSLFTLLRDTHHNPHAALHVFQLACATPFSFIKGCTTSLYNQVLRTRWTQGDVEAVASGIDDMRSVGVKIDDKTRDIVNEIGQAIKEDEDLACARYDERRQSSPAEAVDESAANDVAFDVDASTTSSSLPWKQDLEDAAIAKLRLFSPRQIGAWARMEKIVEEHNEEIIAKKRQADEERWRERQRQDEMERQRAEADRPSLFL